MSSQQKVDQSSTLIVTYCSLLLFTDIIAHFEKSISDEISRLESGNKTSAALDCLLSYQWGWEEKLSRQVSERVLRLLP